MDRFVRPGLRLELAWACAWVVASSAWCLTAAVRLGGTADETTYLQAGLDFWGGRGYRDLLRMGTMPLPVQVETLPLALWQHWAGKPYHPVADLWTALPLARAGNLLFWWLLLGYGWLVGRQLAGPWGGALAVALLASEPVLLGHSALATTDLAVTAALMALTFHVRAGRGAGWAWRVGVPACWFAAVVLCKCTGLIFGPLCLAVLQGERLCRQSTPPPTARFGFLPLWPAKEYARGLMEATQVVVVGLALAGCYCRIDPRPGDVEWALDHAPRGPAGRVYVWLARHGCSGTLLDGLCFQLAHNRDGHGGTFLLGRQYEPSRCWFYFPAALLLKLSLPLILGTALLALLRGRSLANGVFLSAAAGLLVFSLVCRVHLGVRYVLPVVALGIVGMAGAAVQAVRAAPPGGLRVLLGASVAAAAASTAFAAAAVWPHGLCYTSPLGGGTADGYLRLNDSNYDWGQGLKDLARWQQAHGAAPLKVWYYGADYTLLRLPMTPILLPEGLALDRQPSRWEEVLRGSRLAVGTTVLSLLAPDSPTRALLARHGPVARTTTFLIYDFAGDGARGTGR